MIIFFFLLLLQVTRVNNLQETQEIKNNKELNEWMYEWRKETLLILGDYSVGDFSNSDLRTLSIFYLGWFLPDQKYVYKYEAVADAGFVGTSDERSGLKLSCTIHVITPCQCNQATKVNI